MGRMRQGGFASAKGDEVPSNVKGIAVSIPLNSVYVSTLESLQRIDLATDKMVWEKPLAGGCDRMSISPDGKTMYLPSLEKTFWNVVDCETGDIITKIDVTKSTQYDLWTFRRRCLFGRHCPPWLYVADAKTQELVSKVGPFLTISALLPSMEKKPLLARSTACWVLKWAT